MRNPRLLALAAPLLLGFFSAGRPADVGPTPPREPPAPSPASATTEAFPQSSRLAAVAQKIGARRTDPLPDFWREVTEQGTPLVEVLASDPEKRLITFVYRGSPETRTVVVLGSVTGGAAMAPLRGTNLWFKSVVVPKDARFTYRLAATRGGGAGNADRILDPLNLHPYPASAPLLSLVELPDAPAQPWLAHHAGTATGKVEATSLRSTLLREERPIWIYRPPGYTPQAGPYPLLLVLDGSAYLELIALPWLLDNLIAAGKIPPLIAVLEGRLEAESRDRTLACHPVYAQYLEQELLPWARSRARIVASPTGVAIAGSSLGGLAATCAALAHPDLFGAVLAQSGAFWWKTDSDPLFEAVARRIETSERLAIRFALDVGTFESWPVEEGGPSLLEANRHLRATLEKKGYEVRYREFHGGHGYANWQATLPEALLGLLAQH